MSVIEEGEKETEQEGQQKHQKKQKRQKKQKQGEQAEENMNRKGTLTPEQREAIIASRRER